MLQTGVHLSFSDSNGLLEKVTAGMGFAPYIPRGDIRLDVLLTERASRVTLQEPDRPIMTFVIQPGQVSVWDQGSRTWWSLSAQAAPALQPPHIPSVIVEQETLI